MNRMGLALGAFGVVLAGLAWAQGIGPLPAPTGLTASDGTVCGMVSVRWTPVEGAAGYRVERDGLAVADWLDAPAYEDEDIVPGTIYTYRVQARDGVGEGALSAPETGYAYAAPARPKWLTASDGVYEDRVRIVWATVPGALAYQVERSATADFAAPTVLEPGWAAGNTLDDQSMPRPLQPGFLQCAGPAAPQEYYYRVVARNGCGESAPGPSDAGSLAAPGQGLAEAKGAWREFDVTPPPIDGAWMTARVCVAETVAAEAPGAVGPVYAVTLPPDGGKPGWAWLPLPMGVRPSEAGVYERGADGRWALLEESGRLETVHAGAAWLGVWAEADGLLQLTGP